MNNEFYKTDPDFDEINFMFFSIKEIIQKNSEDKSTVGMSGWCDEERRIFENILFQIQDGGYSSVLSSSLYNFKIVSSYTYKNGSSFNFHSGSLNEMRQCFNYLKSLKTQY